MRDELFTVQLQQDKDSLFFPVLQLYMGLYIYMYCSHALLSEKVLFFAKGVVC